MVRVAVGGAVADNVGEGLSVGVDERAGTGVKVGISLLFGLLGLLLQDDSNNTTAAKSGTNKKR